LCTDLNRGRQKNWTKIFGMLFSLCEIDFSAL